MLGTGALPDPYDARDHSVRALLVGTGMIPSSVRYDSACGPARNQYGLQACTGFEITKRAYGWARIRGIPCEEFAPLAAYWLGRMVGRLAGEPTGDVGAYPRRVARAHNNRYGFVPETAFPFSEARVNEPLNWAEIRNACSHTFESYYRILSAGDDRCFDMRSALAEGHPLGITIDARLVGATGLHRVLVCGYEPGRFRFLNSWGTSWGDDGLGWLTDEQVAQSTRDIEVGVLCTV